MNNEPKLDDIEDYNNNESPQKRRTVILVVIFCLIVGLIFSMLRGTYSDNEEYIGTPENPGINTTKTY